jgi:uncharacterized protein YndB with AHSA1/START domain
VATEGEDNAMPTITNSVTITAAPDEVWAVLADLPATRQWLPGVVAVRMNGTQRVCVMADGQEIHEQIDEVSDEQRSLQLHHLRVPLPIHHSGGTFTVSVGDDPGSAAVTLTTTFEPLDPTMVDDLIPMIHGAFQQSLEALRRYVEEKVTWDAG